LPISDFGFQIVDCRSKTYRWQVSRFPYRPIETRFASFVNRLLTVLIYNKIGKNINCTFTKLQEKGMELNRNSILLENLVDSESKKGLLSLKEEGRKRNHGSTQLFTSIGFHKGNYR
jgi:hypothetical protein